MSNLDSFSFNLGYRNLCRLSRLLLLVLVTGCASSAFDYAEDLDFSQFKTVALAPDSDESSLDGARIATAASTLLPSRGLALAPTEQAALWLHYQVQTYTRTYPSMAPIIFPDRYGGGRTGYASYWNGDGPEWEQEEVAVREQRLLLWLTTAGGSRVIWRSQQQAAFPRQQVHGAPRSAIITQQVEELLANYPPPQTH